MHDNELLVEFDFIIDLDLAMFKYIKHNFKDSIYVNQDLINEKDERRIIFELLSRPHINPLELILPNTDSLNLYYDIMNNHYDELLSHAKAYDTFGLMISFLNNASSVGITILCKNDLERDFIKSLNPKLNCIVIPKRMDVPLSNYTAIYSKYIPTLSQYMNLKFKHIYIAAAKFNMEEDKDMVSGLCVLYSEYNQMHLIDLYTKVKYRFSKREDEDNE